MNIIFNIHINANKLKRNLEKISSWEDWYKIEKEIFHTDEWPVTSFDRLEEDLDRPVQIIEGYKWEPTTDLYDISPDVSHLYEKTRQKVFAIL